MDGDGFETSVLAVVASIPPGQVLSYGEVAEEAGRPRAARAVGNVLARTTVEVPWWRVVRWDGSLATGKEPRQAALLRAEGVELGGPPGRPRVVRFAAARPRPRHTGRVESSPG